MDCQNFANDVALAFQQIFDIGGWNAVLWVFIGFVLGGGLAAFFEYFYNRFQDMRRSTVPVFKSVDSDYERTCVVCGEKHTSGVLCGFGPVCMRCSK